MGSEVPLPSFDRIRYRRHDADVFMWAFDLIELDGADMRREPLAQARGYRVEAADSFYFSGRSRHWIKSKNPNAPAVKREADEDWRNERLEWGAYR
jgi:ATP-dependent DNA ligase